MAKFPTMIKKVASGHEFESQHKQFYFLSHFLSRLELTFVVKNGIWS